jgi:succinate dehydrogenase / fumarate reductase flavoprotein subunit
MNLDARIPSGPIEHKWTKLRDEIKLLSPANKRKHTVIVVGTGLAGASAAATLAELGYKVLAFCFQDSARRAHSIAAQGGINAAKNYQNDSDTVFRLFYDTIKGGDYLADQPPIQTMCNEAPGLIRTFDRMGVTFSRTPEGIMDQRLFGGVFGQVLQSGLSFDHTVAQRGKRRQHFAVAFADGNGRSHQLIEGDFSL